MDTAGYSKWDSRSGEVLGGLWGRWEYCKQRFFFLTLVFLVATVLWALILSILLSKASMERGVLLGQQDLLKTNASEQMVVLGTLKAEVGACNSCCLGTKTKLQTTLTELGETQAKVLQQESALKELQERVTQGLAEAGRDREDVRTELFRVLEGIKFQNGSCELCPKSWLPFQGSCYYFSEPPGTWEKSQHLCAKLGAHLVIIGGLEEQGFLNQHTRGLGYWLGLRAVRRFGRVQSYQWVDGVSLSFSYWNTGEPNDSNKQEDCVMMLHSGLWNDAPCSSEMDGCICEKRRSC
ncbi:C-type lectin domain family 4 member G isoform X1 [Sciurus carolinensis]|uniref:C-type lectin domain family 4 member G isoform X1 n=2 Tax=Sciurus carolinensis TaxID=30640 RepID=UPI001FB21506|nr:C-type lectin domain family 4 member G isoform X1 [Sciurus carolinensis]